MKKRQHTASAEVRPWRATGTIHLGWCLFALAVLFCIGLPVFSDDPPPAARAVLSSGCEYDYPPFCFVASDGLADGFSVELLRAAARIMNFDVTFRIGPWEEIKGLLERGEIQALPLVGRTP